MAEPTLTAPQRELLRNICQACAPLYVPGHYRPLRRLLALRLVVPWQADHYLATTEGVALAALPEVPR